MYLLAAAALSVCLPAQQPQKAAAQTTTTASSVAFQQFEHSTAGNWTVTWCAATGTPRAIWGNGLPLADWRENTLAEARRHAEQLLRERSDVLGLGTSEFREIIGSRMGRTWTLTYDQFFAGLPVIGGRADVRVNMSGRIAMFGSTAWPIAADFATAPQIGPEVATAAAWQALGQNPTDVAQPAPTAAPRLVIWGDVHATQLAPLFLAWEVAVSNVDQNGTGTIGRYYIDARTAAVLHFTSDKHECGFTSCTIGKPAATETVGPTAPLALPVNTTVTVMGWTRTGLDANNPITNVPMPGLVLSVPGIGNVTTDNNGQFTINIAAPVSITVGALDGRHHGAIAGANAPSGSFTVNPGIASTIQLLTAAATTNQASHTTATLWIDRVNEYSRSILGNSAELGVASAIGVTVNIASTCNAFYSGNAINFYSAGGGCTNTATNTIIAHEWGHGIDDRYGGISQTNGLSEGWGDIFGMYIVDDSRVGSGFQTPNVGLRDGTNTQQYPGGSGVHAQGQSWMGFAWKLRNRLATTLGNRPAAIALTNDIVISSIAADAVDQAAAVIEVFIADDNDGNLNNGTPHSPDLIWACQQHSLPYPGQPGLTNNECAGAIAVVSGVNGPFSNSGATTSAPAWPCASGGNDVWFTCNVSAPGTLSVSLCTLASFDTALQIFSGSCGTLTSLGCNDDSCSLQSSLSVPVVAGPHFIRIGGFNGAAGSFSINVSGPIGAPATMTPYGTGCYAASKAFYELFPAAGFDLQGQSMRLTRDAAGFYIASAAGAYVVPPVTATSLALLDDSFVAVTLASAFPYPGGTTTSLEVCSNGFVSATPGNGAGFTPTAAVWIASPAPRWGTWHDFNPTIAGSGQVKFHQAGTVSYVTWDGVLSHTTTTGLNTLQLQFDRATGNVTYCWPTVFNTGNGWLVGYAAATPNDDLGSMDISARLPGTFRNNAVNAPAITLTSTLPQLGTTVTMTATNYPSGSGLGVQAISLVRNDPGIDLTSVGMPGCFRYSGLEATVVVVPVGGQSTYSLGIPSSPSFIGLPLNSQTWAFAPGANSLGVVSSNGVALVVGV